MKLIARIFFSLTLLVVLSACNDQTTAHNNVAVLDLEAIVKATKQDEVFQAQINQADADLSNQLKELAASMENKLAEIRSGFGDKPSDQQQAQYQQNLQQANVELRQKQALAKTKLQQYEINIITAWREKVKPVAQSVADDKGADIVMVSSPSLMWFRDSVDITDEVLAVLRKQSSDVQSTNQPAGSESAVGDNP